jgi:hypothetical protein
MKKEFQNKQTQKASIKPKSIVSVQSRGNTDFFSLPAGSKLNDLYMDAQQVAIELNISKRTIRNMRKSKILSFTKLYCKIFYYRQEIAAILEANKISQNDNIPLRKINEAISKMKKK